MKKSYKFSTTSVAYYFSDEIFRLKNIVDQKNTIIITDENIFGKHVKKFRQWNSIVLKPGEEFKVQSTVDSILLQLLEMGADRNTTLVGVGGGVVTDITGYVASIYMRGINFGFVPTTLLAMIDASIGGKNGIDIGVYKNMAGIIRQPKFILHDLEFLKTLPKNEWENGFAEIIKHACIKDDTMFRELELNSLKIYQTNKKKINDLINRNTILKTKVVQRDEFEKGERRLLNFGHTLGHALENQYELSHGQSIAIGMAFASIVSQKINGFKEAHRVINLLSKYGLPTFASFDKQKVLEVLKKDKKREKSAINYILLERIGKGVSKLIPITELENIIQDF
ncbi:MAG: 3-dehydroquinate synthase [Chitinophagaceae bacterium]|nr:MAG: 3-dehydroquinate synthase [Chitinophagaceae bacterium]